MAKSTRRAGLKPRPVSSTSTPIAVLSADWHLADSAFAGSDVTGDAYVSLGQVVDIAIKYNVPLVAAGDLFDKRRPSPLAVSFAHSEMHRMRDAGLPVYFVTGQHCRTPDTNAATPVEWLCTDGIAWPTHVDRQVFKLGDFLCYGLDWRSPSELQPEFENIPTDVSMLVMHQIIEELRSGNMILPEMSLTETPSNVSTVYSGDWHVCGQRCATRDDGTVVWGLSSGSLAMQDVTEPPEKFVYLLMSDGSTESVRLRTRPFLSITIRSEDELDEITATLASDVERLAATPGISEIIRKPLIAVAHSSDVPSVMRRLRSMIGDDAFIRFRPLPNQRVKNAAVDTTPRTTFDDAVTSVSTNKLACELASKLHHSTDPAATLAAFKQRYFGANTP